MKCLKLCTVRMLIGDGAGQPIKGNIVGQYKMQTADCRLLQTIVFAMQMRTRQQ